MVAFRKLFPVLAIGAFFLGTASTASAQATGTPLVCATDAGVPPVVRAEGHTELVGDILIVCTGGNPNQAMTANFQLFLNTNVTSRLIGGLSEALLMIDEPGAPRVNRGGAPANPTPFCVAPTGSPLGSSNSAPALVGGLSTVPGLTPGGLFGTGVAPTATATCPGGNPGLANGGTANPNETFQQGTYTVFRGIPANAANGTANAAVVWPGVPIVPPGSTGQRVIRITNVRANAAGVPASASLVPAQIFAFISVSASQSLALNNPQQAVAFVLPGLQFDVRTCTGGGGAPFTFLQCQNQNSALFGDPNRGAASTDRLFGVRFREGFQTAFKVRMDPTQLIGIPGVVYNTESGFVRPEPELASVGVADTGTRVRATFNNIPEGTRIFVSTVSVFAPASADIGTPTASAVLVATDASGAGGGSTANALTAPIPVPATTNIACATGATATPAAELTVTGTGTGRSAMAVWELTSANSAALDTLFFPVAVAFAANTTNNLPGLGTSSVTGSFAPFYPANSTTANLASATLPIPRFIDNAAPRNDFIINQCVSNLLFPFVTNAAGFDTGIAISNTSMDPFGGTGRQQAGTCTINYYGTTPGGPAPPPDTSTNPVASGAQLLFVLSSGGANGIDAVPGFQGYIIAQCRFQYAHGFAFISDGPIGAARVAEGYLALVMDDSLGASRTGSFSETLGN